MLHLVVALAFFVAIGAVVGLVARLITFDRFRLSLPKTVALGTLGAVVGAVAQWFVLTPEARDTQSGTAWFAAVLGAVATMALYRTWFPATTAKRHPAA